MAKEKLGIYGGAFSPIHEGHVKAALAFLEATELDRLLIMPTANPPHKVVSGATAEERYEMARLAFCETEAYKSGKLEVSDFELRREGKSYTVYTLEHFSDPDRELYLLVGTDMFLSLGKWFRADDIFALAHIVLMRRENDEKYRYEIAERKREYELSFDAEVCEIDEPPTVVSSTELRLRIQNGEDLAGYVPDAVVKYIGEKNLYRVIG